MANFPTNRSLLNPKFEGYKFSSLPQDEYVLRFPLTALPTQANVSGRSRTPLSFEEVQSRITHNHLAISKDAQSAVYVDDDLNVIRVVLNPVSRKADSSNAFILTKDIGFDADVLHSE